MRVTNSKAFHIEHMHQHYLLFNKPDKPIVVEKCFQLSPQAGEHNICIVIQLHYLVELAEVQLQGCHVKMLV